MRGKDLLECIEQIDDALVEEAMEPSAISHRTNRLKNSPAVRWGMAAACVVVIGISAVALWSSWIIPDEQKESIGKDTATQRAMDSGGNNKGNGQSDGSLAMTDKIDVLSDSSLVADEGNDSIGDLPDSNMAAGAATGSDDIYSLSTADEYVGSGRNDSASQDTASDGADNTVSQDTTSDSDNHSIGWDSAANYSDSTADRDSTADMASGKERTLKDTEKAKTESASEDLTKRAYTVISDYYGEKDDSVYDYSVPEKGKVTCYHYLYETMKHYAELENAIGDTDSPIYAYDIVIDIYGDVEVEGGRDVHYEALNMQDINVGNEMIEQEYRRLEELGYRVRLSEDFQLTGTFTKEEIDTFPTLSEYGYNFRFASEY